MNKAQQSAFNALGNNYEGEQLMYTGLGDPGVQFEGNASSFADENKSGLLYTMTLTNTGSAAVDRTIAICPAYFTTAASIKDNNGNAVAAIITDGTIVGAAGTNDILSGAGKPKPIVDFLAFVKFNPTRFTGLKIQVDNSGQFDEIVYVKQNSPFRTLPDFQLQPNAYKDSTQNDDKRVEIPLENFQMDNNTSVIYTIQAGRTVTLTWFAGAIKNAAAELAQKAEFARANMGIAREYGKR